MNNWDYKVESVTSTQPRALSFPLTEPTSRDLVPDSFPFGLAPSPCIPHILQPYSPPHLRPSSLPSPSRTGMTTGSQLGIFKPNPKYSSHVLSVSFSLSSPKIHTCPSWPKLKTGYEGKFWCFNWKSYLGSCASTFEYQCYIFYLCVFFDWRPSLMGLLSTIRRVLLVMWSLKGKALIVMKPLVLWLNLIPFAISLASIALLDYGLFISLMLKILTSWSLEWNCLYASTSRFSWYCSSLLCLSSTKVSSWC